MSTSPQVTEAAAVLRVAERRLEVATAQYRLGVCGDAAYLRARSNRDAALSAWEDARRADPEVVNEQPFDLEAFLAS